MKIKEALFKLNDFCNANRIEYMVTGTTALAIRRSAGSVRRLGQPAGHHQGLGRHARPVGDDPQKLGGSVGSDPVQSGVFRARKSPEPHRCRPGFL